MSRKMKKLIGIWLISSPLLFFYGCHSSSGGDDDNQTGSVDALSVNSKVSVVEAKESSATSSAISSVGSLVLDVASIQAAINTESLSTNSDYHKDETQVYVNEKTSRSLDTVNMILCYFDQIQYDKMLNLGNYKAQVDESQCDMEKGNSSSDSGSGGGSNKSAGNQVTYSYWTANSSRTDNSSLQIVKVWVEATEDDPQYIKAKLSITEGSSSGNSLGIFRLDFAGYEVDNNGNPTSQTTMKGYMYTEQESSDQVALKFYNVGSHKENNDVFHYEEGINVTRNPTGSEGSGSALGQKWDQDGPTAIVYNFSYNNDYFYRGNENKVVCLDRNNFNETAWRYGVYDSNGARVDISSGFPIRYESGDKTFHGWIGYWGLWMPSEAGVTNGTVVTKEAFGSNETEENYMVFQVGGKLEKHTKKTLTMDQIENIPLSWWDNDNNKDFQVLWNGSNLVKVAERSNATNWRWSAITETVIQFSAGTYGFFFYSESLGGDGQIKFDNWNDITNGSGSVVPTISANSTVIFHIRETVFPEDTVPDNLVCFDHCPDPGKLDQSNYYFTTDWNDPQATEYTFEDSILKYSGTPVVMTQSSQNNKHGVWSGALFEDTQANRNKLACPWDSSKTCAWQAWEKLAVYYTWSTGPHDWQKLTTLKSGSDYLEFDSPMQIKYTHQSGEYANTTFYLEYQGFGNLHGIPEMCVNMATGEELDCWSLTDEDYSSGNIRWMRQFVIPNGSQATGTDADATEYVIKALEVEQAMKVVDNSNCTHAGLTLSSRALPDTDGWEDPNVGNAPIVTGPPAVIGGVVQTQE